MEVNPLGQEQLKSLTIMVDDPASPEIRDLVEMLDSYQEALYPAESNHLVPVDSLRQVDVTFLSARIGGCIVGCGAIVNRGEYAEIKRMFVLPQFRGRGVARKILEDLESRAQSLGLTLSRLETGIYQGDAIALYERAGYRRCPPFGEYKEDPLSVFMEKRLD